MCWFTPLCVVNPCCQLLLLSALLLLLCLGTYANLVKQAKSKQKILDKMYEAGLTQVCGQIGSGLGHGV